eukprot:CAMPEP_0201514056 /NCGR_PEP_ID=MMETSP0161_2-20130828/5983_1 /ASSEMBLY_ACC=CAM_ASM_000251 /TAXON_ID=180227 /ORGANISM="Neoparamoeba aestuarina, Strain SoJaBio B1-5/56/2" /LENGTH=70 /DNA_ID=CAMNT_0047910495 /DNA_START=210 /DNA_END=419 /DNA_ORIENTATION=-
MNMKHLILADNDFDGTVRIGIVPPTLVEMNIDKNSKLDKLVIEGVHRLGRKGSIQEQIYTAFPQLTASGG